jgi:uncharacterized protein (TIGR02001 family)
VRKVLLGLACASVLASPAAMAGATGNVGGVSEYMFRGIAQTGGAAIQGGVDYATDVGLYVGTWGSNIGFAGGTEVDWYGGFTTKLSDTFGIDVGAIYYTYSEEDEAAPTGTINPDTVEVYAGVIVGPVTVKYYYSDEAAFFGAPDPVTGEADESHYVTAALAHPLSKSLALNLSVGYYFGDVIEDFLGPNEKSYTDYSIGLSKSFDSGFTASFTYVDTNIDVVGFEDDPKFVLGLKKSFDL